MMLLSKSAHGLTAMIFVVAGLFLIGWYPALTKDPAATLGTVGSLATGYGVVFAIVELRRAATASELARAEAQRVFKAVTSLVTAREIVECQSVIETAVSALDEGRIIPSASISRIIKLYSQVFYAELSEENSVHRSARSLLESYSFNPNVVGSKSTKRTKTALLTITGHLAQLQGATKNFTEFER